MEPMGIRVRQQASEETLKGTMLIVMQILSLHTNLNSEEKKSGFLEDGKDRFNG